MTAITKPWAECTVLVTGGHGDIGKALVAAFQDKGARVFTTSRSAQEEQTLLWDMAEPDSTAELITQIKQRKLKFDLLVHCAHQFSDAKLILQVSPDDLQRSLTTNLVPLYELMRFLARSMYRQKFGRVLLLGSFISVCGGAGKIPYIIEKSAFNGFARGFNAEFAEHGVVTSVLHPAIVETESIGERVPHAVLEQMKAASDSQQLLSVDAVVDACLALLDPTQAISGRIEVQSGGAPW